MAVQARRRGFIHAAPSKLCVIVCIVSIVGSTAAIHPHLRQLAPQCVRCVSGTNGICQSGDGVCWPTDVSGSCPARTFACTCPICFGTTAGPCHFDDGSCGGYATGTGLCPVGSWECHSGADNAPTPSNSPTPYATPTTAPELNVDSSKSGGSAWSSGMSFLVAGVILVGAAIAGSVLYALRSHKRKQDKDAVSAFSGNGTVATEKSVDLEHGTREKSEGLRGTILRNFLTFLRRMLNFTAVRVFFGKLTSFCPMSCRC
jgi:hypothetical protein